MKYYQEITLLDDENMRFFDLWSKLYKQLHLALADIKNKHGVETIGVCFPQYRFEKKEGKTFAKLGSKLRIFGVSHNDLEHLNLADWLSKLNDYVHIKSINSVGDKATKQVVVTRYQYKNNLKQAQAFAQHKNIDIKKALAHCIAYKNSNENYPFIRLYSEQTQQTYTLAIKQEESSLTQLACFNSYGLSHKSNLVALPFW